jgi:phosphoribosylformylglycinamidine synthase
MRRVGVVTFPGSNCDADMRHAVSATSGLSAVPLWHKDADLRGVDAVILPGGFSFGDYLRCGAIARFSPVMGEVARFAAQGRPVIGVCNGFQILCEAGLLPGVLLRNEGLKFICADVHLRSEGRASAFVPALPRPARVPVAHAEGRWYADDDTVARLSDAGQLVLRYVTASGEAGGNPNGAVADVAGVCNEAGNVVGLMPHPERVVEPLQGGTDGLAFFARLAEVLA